VIIIDDSIVITGSFNFTKSADRYNDDNVLIIHSLEVAKLYNAEFQRVYGIANTPNSAKIKCTH
jgi:phospholipase D